MGSDDGNDYGARHLFIPINYGIHKYVRIAGHYHHNHSYYPYKIYFPRLIFHDYYASIYVFSFSLKKKKNHIFLFSCLSFASLLVLYQHTGKREELKRNEKKKKKLIRLRKHC